MVQPQYSPYKVGEQIALLYCSMHSLMSNIKITQVPAFINKMLERLAGTEAIASLQKGLITDEIGKSIETIAADVTAELSK